MGKAGIAVTLPGCTPPDEYSHTPGEDIPEALQDFVSNRSCKHGFGQCNLYVLRSVIGQSLSSDAQSCQSYSTHNSRLAPSFENGNNAWYHACFVNEKNNNQALCFACISINSILYNRNRRNSGSCRGKASVISAVRAIDSLLVLVVLNCAIGRHDVC